MKEPVSSMDVEDVLSSIRRLVSEEAKGTGPHGESSVGIASSGLHEAADNVAGDALAEIVYAMGESDEENPVGIPPSNDISEDNNFDDPEELRVSFRHQAASAARRASDQKLVLTDAFRVADPVSESEPGNDTLDDARDDVVTETTEIVEPRNKLSLHPHLRSVDNSASEKIDSPLDNDRPSARLVRATAFGSSPEEALFDRADQEMNGIRPSEETATNVDTSVAADFELPESEDFQEEDFAEEVETVEDVPQAEIVDADVQEIDASESDSAEDTANPSPFAAASGAFSDVENAEEVQAEKPDTVEEEEPSTINFAEEEGSILDEETLRDLVSEMVREELQGELGDRITRNVRKLVRREIQRSLASREFE